MESKFFAKYLFNRLKYLSKEPCMTNIYHASIQKTGSQWVKAIFNDPLVREKSKLAIYPQHRYEWDEFHKIFPKYTFVPGLYISYQSYEEILKPERYKTLYIYRDPRDLIVSWYYSMKYSHGSIGKVYKQRKNLKDLSEEEGKFIV